MHVMGKGKATATVCILLMRQWCGLHVERGMAADLCPDQLVVWRNEQWWVKERIPPFLQNFPRCPLGIK